MNPADIEFSTLWPLPAWMSLVIVVAVLGLVAWWANQALRRYVDLKRTQAGAMTLEQISDRIGHGPVDTKAGADQLPSLERLLAEGHHDEPPAALIADKGRPAPLAAAPSIDAIPKTSHDDQHDDDIDATLARFIENLSVTRPDIVAAWNEAGQDEGQDLLATGARAAG